jgi:hypothetical protein
MKGAEIIFAPFFYVAGGIPACILTSPKINRYLPTLSRYSPKFLQLFASQIVLCN